MRVARYAVLLVVLIASARTSHATPYMAESFRSEFGTPRAVCVNPNDGSCWAAVGSTVLHIDRNGILLSQSNGFWNPESVSVSAADGSCWVADTSAQEIVHLASDGSELWRGWGFPHIISVSANSLDGSCWLASYGSDQVVHLGADGARLLDLGGFHGPSAVAADPSDGSCRVGWASEAPGSGVARIAPDGLVMWANGTLRGPSGLALNASDGSCWVADQEGGSVVHFAANGAELWRGSAFARPMSVSCNPTDGSCWVADWTAGQVIHLASDGTESLRLDGFDQPMSVSANPRDGSCWVADMRHGQLVHVSADGRELARYGPTCATRSVSVNDSDGSCWTFDEVSSRLVHSDAAGIELWSGGSLSTPARSVAANAFDGSCWVTDGTEIVRFAEDGRELWRSRPLTTPNLLATDSTDDSCWVVARDGTEVVRLNRAGTVLWSATGFAFVTGIAIDGSGVCWVADAGADRAIRLNPDGWRVGQSALDYGSLIAIAVDRDDRSCWVLLDEGVGSGVVVHLDAEGRELRRVHGFSSGGALSVNQTDGSCWVIDEFNYQAVQLASDGSSTWWGGGYFLPTSIGANPLDGSAWIADAGNRQLAHLTVLGVPVARFDVTPTAGVAPLQVTFTNESDVGTLSSWRFGDGDTSRQRSPEHIFQRPGRYSARLMVTNTEGYDTELKRRAVRVAFSDAPPGYWAREQILACVEAGIVVGYNDVTYRPTLPVSRDQMAVYIARAMATPMGDAGLAAFRAPAAPSFGDVSASHWAYKYIEYAKQQGIVEGYFDNTYRPDLAVDRGQMAVFVARAIASPPGEAGLETYIPPAQPTFVDVPGNFWASKYVEYIKSRDVTSGYPDKLYHPEYVCTRDQMAVYVQRAFGLAM